MELKSTPYNERRLSSRNACSIAPLPTSGPSTNKNVLEIIDNFGCSNAVFAFRVCILAHCKVNKGLTLKIQSHTMHLLSSLVHSSDNCGKKCAAKINGCFRQQMRLPVGRHTVKTCLNWFGNGFHK